jgi:hypothetical protein
MRSKSTKLLLIAFLLVLYVSSVVSQAASPRFARNPPDNQQDANKAPTIVDTWEGVLSAGGQKLRLVLKVSNTETGLKAVMDSLDQPNSNNLAVDSITFQNNQLHFEMKALSIVYEGTMNKEGTEIVGTFTQGPGSLPLIFRKSGVVRSFASVQRGRIQMKPCNNPSLSSEVLCGKYEVFEDRAAQKGRRIALNIVLLPAKDAKPSPDALFYLAGGPGGAATGYATEKFIEGLRRHRDVVLVDQRGTGESNPLNCPSAGSREDMRGFFGEPFPLERIRACRTELEKIADLKQYTTSIAMDDLDEVRAALGYDRINVYGGSYGSTTTSFIYGSMAITYGPQQSLELRRRQPRFLFRLRGEFRMRSIDCSRIVLQSRLVKRHTLMSKMNLRKCSRGLTTDQSRSTQRILTRVLPKKLRSRATRLWIRFGSCYTFRTLQQRYRHSSILAPTAIWVH